MDIQNKDYTQEVDISRMASKVKKEYEGQGLEKKYKKIKKIEGEALISGDSPIKIDGDTGIKVSD